jgi:cytidylate kinase
MLVVFLDGESKSGKTAVGKAIKQTLETQSYGVRQLIAGNFFRHLTLLAWQRRPNEASDNEWLQPAVRDALHSEELYAEIQDLDALNTSEIDNNVSKVGQFDFVQAAASAWRVKSAQKALDDGVNILLFDGRNLRTKLRDWCVTAKVQVALELIIACRPEVAAARYLADEGNTQPNQEQLTEATKMINDRRQRDRDREHAAYVEPPNPVDLVVGTHSVDQALEAAWSIDVVDPPRPIRFDNSEVPRDDGLATVTDLATKAVKHLKL